MSENHQLPKAKKILTPSLVEFCTNTLASLVYFKVVDTIQGACGTPVFLQKLNFNLFQVINNGFGWYSTLLNSLILK